MEQQKRRHLIEENARLETVTSDSVSQLARLQEQIKTGNIHTPQSTTS
jgi:hypothetical protein